MYGHPYGYVAYAAGGYPAGYMPGYGVGQTPPPPSQETWASPAKQHFSSLSPAQQETVRSANLAIHKAVKDLLAQGVAPRWVLQMTNRFVAMELGGGGGEPPIYTAWDSLAPSEVPPGGPFSAVWNGSAWVQPHVAYVSGYAAGQAAPVSGAYVDFQQWARRTPEFIVWAKRQGTGWDMLLDSLGEDSPYRWSERAQAYSVQMNYMARRWPKGMALLNAVLAEGWGSSPLPATLPPGWNPACGHSGLPPCNYQ